MNVHTTKWEDDRIAGFTCPSNPVKEVYTLCANELGHCPFCGKKLLLVWNVYIQEVEDDSG